MNNTNLAFQEENTDREFKIVPPVEKKESLLIQKVVGLGMIAIGIVIPFIMDGDATASILYVGIGLVALFSKKKLTDWENE